MELGMGMGIGGGTGRLNKMTSSLPEKRMCSAMLDNRGVGILGPVLCFPANSLPAGLHSGAEDGALTLPR